MFFEKQILRMNNGLIFNEAADNLPQGTGDNITLESKLLFKHSPQSSQSPISLSTKSCRDQITYLFSIHIKHSGSPSGLNVNN